MLTLTRALGWISAVVLSVVGLQGCTTAYVDHSTPVSVNGGQTIAVMPFRNLSGSRFAGLRSSILTSNVLAARGVNVVRVPYYRYYYRHHKMYGVMGVRGDLAWARAHGIRLAIVGVVNEWGYRRVGNTVFPVVSVSMALRDTVTGAVLWSATGVRDNSFQFYYQSSASSAAESLIMEELSSLSFYGPRYVGVYSGNYYTRGYYGNYGYYNGYYIAR